MIVHLIVWGNVIQQAVAIKCFNAFNNSLL